MKKSLLLCTTFVLTSSFVGYSHAKEDVVYGEDNRIETFEATAMEQRLAKSTAGMIKTIKTITVGNKVMLPPYTLEHDMRLCKGERFSEQPSAVICSGFLVGPDLLVTAGHCVKTQEDCADVSWVFDYKINKSNKRADVLVPAKNVFKCKKVIEAKLESKQDGTRIDYSLIKLDRVVKGRSPLKYRTKGTVALNQDIVVIGHPSGLPQKVAGGAKVLQNTTSNYFKTNLDTFGGNSGSAVFNADNGQVEGILVRGAKDYESDPAGCRKVHKTTNEITDFAKYGESVSRMSDIKTLKYLKPFLKAAKNGDLKTVKELASKINDIDINDNKLNTAFHYAATNNHVEVMDYLIKNNADINAQNNLGETALHLAAFNNSKAAVKLLINNNADTLVKDNFGKLASQRTNYLALGTRAELKAVEKNQKKKKKSL